MPHFCYNFCCLRIKYSLIVHVSGFSAHHYSQKGRTPYSITSQISIQLDRQFINMYHEPQKSTINGPPLPPRKIVSSTFRRQPQQQPPLNRSIENYYPSPNHASSINRTLEYQNIERPPPQQKLPPVVRFTFIKNPPLNQQQGRNSDSANRKSFELGEEICQLCEESHQTSQMDSTSRCKHLFCLECLRKYCSYKVRVMEVIVCPDETCHQELDLQGTVFRNMSREDRERYQQFILWRQTVQNPNIRLCPGAHCKGVIDTSRGDFRCPECRVRFCKECLLPQHRGSCDANFEETFSDFKRCPRCRIFIERIDGCNHMTCRCGHQFCYVCLSNWEGSHYVCPPEVRRAQYGGRQYQPIPRAPRVQYHDHQPQSAWNILDNKHFFWLIFAPFALLNIFFATLTPDSSVCMGTLVFNGNTSLRTMMLIFGWLQLYVAIFGTLAHWILFTQRGRQNLWNLPGLFALFIGITVILILVLQYVHSYNLFVYANTLAHICTGPLQVYLNIRYIIHIITVFSLICCSCCLIVISC